MLASASPRRREILERLGIEFEAVVPEGVEELREGDPERVVVENARRKARAVRGRVGDRAAVLGVDTDVALDGRLLGKPADAARARGFLHTLAGRGHQVLSGVVVLGGEGAPPGGERSALARTRVVFAPLDEATIERYVASGEWRGRAGGYAIQGLGSILVAAIEGDFSNVVGLPVGTLLRLAPELDPGPRG